MHEPNSTRRVKRRHFSVHKRALTNFWWESGIWGVWGGRTANSSQTDCLCKARNIQSHLFLLQLYPHGVHMHKNVSLSLLSAFLNRLESLLVHKNKPVSVWLDFQPLAYNLNWNWSKTPSQIVRIGFQMQLSFNSLLSFKKFELAMPQTQIFPIIYAFRCLTAKPRPQFPSEIWFTYFRRIILQLIPLKLWFLHLKWL